MKFSLRGPGQFKMRLACAAVFIITIAVMAPSTARAQFLHPKVTGKQTTIRNVVILPAKVDIVRSGMKGPEGMAAQPEGRSGAGGKAVAEDQANPEKSMTVSG